MRQGLITVIIFYLIVFAVPKSKAQIVINEILASNTSTNLDEHSKDFLDWIELYNYTDKVISIGGWYLSDDKNKPTKWQIPFSFWIAPKGYRLFWADNMDISKHTNFKLNVEGESIYLYNKDTIIVDSIIYPPQVPDISYGRVAGSLDQWMYFHEATPIAENPFFGYKVLYFSNEPIFSKNAGFYEKSFYLELSVSSNTEKIYYTLDGSKPTQSSNQYSVPIEIANNTVVRAIIYSESKLPSKVITQTYFIKESYSLPVVSLSVDPKYFWDKNVGIYVKGSNYVPDVWESANYFESWERPINVEFFDSSGKTGFNINAGVTIHGRSTRNYAQKTLAIYARNKYGSSSIPYQIFGSESSESYKTFLLRNGGNDWGATMFLDGLIHTLVNNKIDIDAQLYQPAIVFLNGKYWGIHNIREKINESYIKNNHQIGSNKIDIVEVDDLVGELRASNGNMNEYNKMIEFIKKNELSAKENYDTVKKWIDINQFIDYLATQVYINNTDWPGSNMKCWKERDKSGKWRWILYDTELSFLEVNGFTESETTIEHMLAENSEHITNREWSNYIIRKLFENDKFKSEFIQRMAVYLNTVFEPDQVLYVIDSLKKNIEPEIKENINRWGGKRQNAYPFLITSSKLAEWELNIKYVIKFAENRPKVLRENMIKYFELKDTVKLKLNVSDKNAGRISVMGYILEDVDFEGYVFADIPIRMEAIPNEGYEFVKWKGKDCEKNCVFTLTNNKKLTAIFKKIE